MTRKIMSKELLPRNSEKNIKTFVLSFAAVLETVRKAQ